MAREVSYVRVCELQPLGQQRTIKNIITWKYPSLLVEWYVSIPYLICVCVCVCVLFERQMHTLWRWWQNVLLCCFSFKGILFEINVRLFAWWIINYLRVWDSPPKLSYLTLQISSNDLEQGFNPWKTLWVPSIWLRQGLTVCGATSYSFFFFPNETSVY